MSQLRFPTTNPRSILVTTKKLLMIMFRLTTAITTIPMTRTNPKFLQSHQKRKKVSSSRHQLYVRQGLFCCSGPAQSMSFSRPPGQYDTCQRRTRRLGVRALPCVSPRYRFMIFVSRICNLATRMEYAFGCFGPCGSVVIQRWIHLVHITGLMILISDVDWLAVGCFGD